MSFVAVVMPCPRYVSMALVQMWSSAAAFLFEYNTVEAVLLGRAVLVSPAGIMCVCLCATNAHGRARMRVVDCDCVIHGSAARQRRRYFSFFPSLVFFPSLTLDGSFTLPSLLFFPSLPCATGAAPWPAPVPGAGTGYAAGVPANTHGHNTATVSCHVCRWCDKGLAHMAR